MAQRDNDLNHETAESSRKTAERSLEVSENTKRDSAYMRNIAMVTLIFLPGTFMAVS